MCSVDRTYTAMHPLAPFSLHSPDHTAPLSPIHQHTPSVFHAERLEQGAEAALASPNPHLSMLGSSTLPSSATVPASHLNSFSAPFSQLSNFCTSPLFPTSNANEFQNQQQMHPQHHQQQQMHPQYHQQPQQPFHQPFHQQPQTSTASFPLQASSGGPCFRAGIKRVRYGDLSDRSDGGSSSSSSSVAASLYPTRRCVWGDKAIEVAELGHGDWCELQLLFTPEDLRSRGTTAISVEVTIRDNNKYKHQITEQLSSVAAGGIGQTEGTARDMRMLSDDAIGWNVSHKYTALAGGRVCCMASRCRL